MGVAVPVFPHLGTGSEAGSPAGTQAETDIEVLANPDSFAPVAGTAVLLVDTVALSTLGKDTRQPHLLSHNGGPSAVLAPAAMEKLDMAGSVAFAVLALDMLRKAVVAGKFVPPVRLVVSVLSFCLVVFASLNVSHRLPLERDVDPPSLRRITVNLRDPPVRHEEFFHRNTPPY